MAPRGVVIPCREAVCNQRDAGSLGGIHKLFPSRVVPGWKQAAGPVPTLKELRHDRLHTGDGLGLFPVIKVKPNGICRIFRQFLQYQLAVRS